MTTPETSALDAIIGDGACLCREIAAKDRPCVVCEARATKATTPIAPAFPMHQATVWSVVVAYRIPPGPDAVHRQMLVMCGAPDGSEIAGIALARVRADTPGATFPQVLRCELVGDAIGTAVRVRSDVS